ncbi:MAG: sigma-54-dependent Fis family transcriptional regulator [Sandaracinus sp.]|nr:sigma-54-dependent Fis family transcriptional regulator [Sandaracinus sp.]
MGGEDVLVLEDVPDRVWRAFQEDREGLARAHRIHLERWARARELGAPRRAPDGEDGLVRGGRLRLRSEALELLQGIGEAALERATAAVTAHDFVLLLADPEAVVVRSQGGGAFRDEAERTRLIPGAPWGEAARGTNAIGTAASELRPTVVLGRAHFADGYQRLACYAAPITDARGRLVGVLDATSRVENAAPEVGAAVFAAAQVLSELLRLEAYASAGSGVLRALFRTLERSPRPALLVEAPGRVARVNGAAREQLGAKERRGRRRPGARETLGLGWDALLDEAMNPTPGGLPLGSGPARGWTLRAEPIFGPEGPPLAVLVHLERRALFAAPAAEAAPDPFAPIFAEDRTLRGAIDWARAVAESDLPIMLLAETGSGKELFANAIHGASPRASGPFVPVNCGAVAPSLLESELFGYVPGAFTGADRSGREGLFQAASGGTLFLDEVAEMPLAMQVALLRVLETGAVRRVGARTDERCDVRVICATCRDLDEAVEAGSFRRDLYYRLKGAAVRLPPLRARSDLAALARRLLAERAQRAGWEAAPRLSGEAAARLAAHDWPGNVRELISTLDVALVMARAQGSEAIEVGHLPPELQPAPRALPAEVEGGALQRAEAEALRQALEESGGNVSAAARRLGVARSTLYRMARKLGVALGKATGRG